MVRYLEDFEPGHKFVSGRLSVEAERIKSFAAEFDPQPFHLNEDSARDSFFNGLAASGWHTAAMTMAVIARRVIADEQAGLGSPGIDELRWKKPVYPGDTLNVRGQILEKTPSRSRPEMGSFRTLTTVTNQNGETVMTFISIVLIRRRPSGE